MLTIQNITKVYKHNVCGWRIAKVETTNTAYLFQLRKPTGENMQVNLERRWSDFNNKKYEMWYWKPSVNGNQYPESLNFEIKIFETPDKFLNALNLLLM